MEGYSVGGNVDEVRVSPLDHVLTEVEKRWMSWTMLVDAGRKKNFEGTVSEKVVARRRARNRAAKASRKANR